MSRKTEIYNEIPVYYCSRCLSLAVLEDSVIDYCADCGGTDIRQASIDQWRELYKNKYNHYLI